MNYFQAYLAEEFAEDYQAGRLSHRAAMDLIGSVTGSAELARSLLSGTDHRPAARLDSAASPPGSGAGGPATGRGGGAGEGSSAGPPPPPSGSNVSPDDPDLSAGGVQFPGEGARLQGYLARPKGEGPFPVVLVCHENRGLTEHIRDVTCRLAKAGYVALAVDLLSRLGGSQAVGSENVPGALAGMPPDQFVSDFLSGWRSLHGQTSAAPSRVGMVGFCFGGGVTWLVATQMAELLAAVPFYGPHPPAETVANIRAPVLAIYAGRDERINRGIPAIQTAMQAHGKVYEPVVYPETDHAFHNDTGPRYDAQAAQDAWRRTLAWFDTYLRGET